MDWYQVEMVRRGWVESKRSQLSSRWGTLRYFHPETDVWVNISVQASPSGEESRVAIVRGVTHPWPVSGSAEEGVLKTEEFSMQVEEKVST